MTRVILFTSGKGGVGKTTLTSNLAYALTSLGEDVVAMDANLTTPNLGLHFGLHLVPKTLHDVLRGRVKLKDATYKHPYGFRVIPASMAVADLTGVDVGKLHDVTMNLLGKADFVIMDCAAGLGAEAVSAIDAADEVILVTNPDMPSVVDALKTVNIAKRLKKGVTGVVLNRVRGKRSELSMQEVEEMLEAPVIAAIPEDSAVAESIAMKTPVIDYSPYSPAAVEINRLAHALAGRPFKERRIGGGAGLLDRMVNWMTR
jgi:septum site-determining protein MinD